MFLQWIKKQKKKQDEPAFLFSQLYAPNDAETEVDHLRLGGERYIRTFFIDGWPDRIMFGYLHTLVSFPADIDFVQYIEPTNKKKILRYLTSRIEGTENKLIERMKWISSRGVRSMSEELEMLNQLRSDIENNRDRIIYFDNFISLAAPNKEELKRKADRLMAKFGGMDNFLKPADNEHDLVFKTVSPLSIKEKNAWKEMNLEAGTNLFPFTQSDWPHERGPMIALNYDTGSPVFFDGFNKKHVRNYGITIIGLSGTGKSAMLKKIMTGEVRYDVFYSVLDIENEFKDTISTLGGVYLPINRYTDLRFNPADIEPEYNEDQQKWIVDLDGKIEDMTKLTAFMAGLGESKEDKVIESYMERAWRLAYTEKNITEDPDSLYEEGYLDKGMFVKKQKKLPPRFSDFYQIFCRMADGQKELKDVSVALERFTEQGTLGLFDCYTNVDLGNTPCIGFGLKELNFSTLRPIAYIVLLSYLENRFIRKRAENDDSLFRVIADECQELLDSPYSSKALETYFRRFRKRKGGPIAATQNFQKFYENKHGRAIVQNSDTKIIFGQHKGDLEACAELFGLTEGEVEFLEHGIEHHAIIKQPKYSVRSVTVFSDWEQRIYFPKHGG